MRTLLALFLALWIAAPAMAQFTPGNAPVRKFRLPGFNREGFRTSLLEGEEARVVSPKQIDVTEMRFSLFQGDEKNTLDTTLLAASATVRMPEPEHFVVEGAQRVRLIRQELDVTGEQWTYDHTKKRLSIGKNVHVVFRAELKDLLK